VTEQETAAVVTGAETTAEKLKELDERFTALIDKLKASEEMHDEERAVRLLAWKLEWDTMMRERRTNIDSHIVAAEANREHAELSRVMVATRHEDVAELSLHRERLESIYREGFADITNALKALTTPTVLAEAHDAMGMQCEAVSGVVRCTRRLGHTGNHGNDYLRQEWS
jgi:hypothetical protein